MDNLQQETDQNKGKRELRKETDHNILREIKYYTLKIRATCYMLIFKIQNKKVLLKLEQ